jgi:hypothetical protein
MRKRTPRVQVSKPHVMQTAERRGIAPVRRTLDESSQRQMKQVLDALRDEIGIDARLFGARSLSTTIIGFSRLKARNPAKLPPTCDIARKIPSSHHPLSAQLGGLGVFGAGNNKLGFKLVSPDIEGEIDQFETEFARRGYRLTKDRNRPDGALPHLSLGQLFEDQIPRFSDPMTLSGLEALPVVSVAMGQRITFEPVPQALDMHPVRHHPDQL